MQIQQLSQIDLVTFLAIWGAILSSILALKEVFFAIRDLRKEKRQLQVRCTFTHDDPNLRFHLPASLTIHIVNTGFRPVNLQLVGLRMSDGSIYKKTSYPNISDVKLDDGDIISVYVLLTDLEGHFSKTVVQNVFFTLVIVKDAEENIYKAKLPKEIRHMGMTSLPFWRRYKSQWRQYKFKWKRSVVSERLEDFVSKGGFVDLPDPDNHLLSVQSTTQTIYVPTPAYVITTLSAFIWRSLLLLVHIELRLMSFFLKPIKFFFARFKNWKPKSALSGQSAEEFGETTHRIEEINRTRELPSSLVEPNSFNKEVLNEAQNILTTTILTSEPVQGKEVDNILVAPLTAEEKEATDSVFTKQNEGQNAGDYSGIILTQQNTILEETPEDTENTQVIEQEIIDRQADSAEGELPESIYGIPDWLNGVDEIPDWLDYVTEDETSENVDEDIVTEVSKSLLDRLLTTVQEDVDEHQATKREILPEETLENVEQEYLAQNSLSTPIDETWLREEDIPKEIKAQLDVISRLNNDPELDIATFLEWDVTYEEIIASTDTLSMASQLEEE